MSTHREQKEQGFTLLEVLVALVILGIAFSASFQIISDGTHFLARADQERTATLVARSLLARIGNDIPIEPGIQEFPGNPVRLQLSMAPAQAASDVSDEPIRAFKIVVTAFWQGQNQPQSLSLTTIRLRSQGP
jgi:prepilin-type N-terminal cleavage/methylation domain-containing protein